MSTLVFIWTAVAIIAYAALANRLFALAAPFRDEAVTAGGELLRSSAISEERKDELEFILDHLAGIRGAWALAVLVLPAAVHILLVGQKEDDWTGIPENLRRLWKRFVTNATMAMLFNSPLALALFTVQFMFATCIAGPRVLADSVVRRAAHSPRVFHHGRVAHG